MSPRMILQKRQSIKQSRFSVPNSHFAILVAVLNSDTSTPKD